MKKPPTPAPAGANPFGERSLRDQLDLDLPAQELPFELLVLADVGRDHLRDLPGLQQNADPEIVDAGVVADDGQPLGAARMQRLDEILGNPAQPESAHHDRRAVGDQGHRGVGALENLVHRTDYSSPIAEITTNHEVRPECPNRSPVRL